MNDVFIEHYADKDIIHLHKRKDERYPFKIGVIANQVNDFYKVVDELKLDQAIKDMEIENDVAKYNLCTMKKSKEELIQELED